MTSSSPHRGVLLAAVGALAVSLTRLFRQQRRQCRRRLLRLGDRPPRPARRPPGSAAAAGQPFGTGCAQCPPPGRAASPGWPPSRSAPRPSATRCCSTLVAAVQKANLVDTLNSTPDITVLAPANPAFQALPPDALNAVLTDTPRLTAVLTHHVIPGRLTPEQLAGQHTTVANDTVTIAGSGTDFTISGDQTLSGSRPRWSAGTCRPRTRPSTSSTRCSSRRRADPAGQRFRRAIEPDSAVANAVHPA